MMFKVIGFVLIALFLVIFFKDKRADLSILIILAAGVLIFIFSLGMINQIIEFIKLIASKASIDSLYLAIILKIVAISYIASFASEICKDAGASSLSSKVEFCGKIFILILALPILGAVLDSILMIL